MPRVNADTPTYTPEQWQSVADHVKARSRELELTIEKLASSGAPPSRSSWGHLFRASQPSGKMEESVLRAASRKLGWTPDSIEKILEGGKPRRATPREEEDPPVGPEQLVAWLADHEARIQALEGRSAHNTAEELREVARRSGAGVFPSQTDRTEQPPSKRVAR